MNKYQNIGDTIYSYLQDMNNHFEYVKIKNNQKHFIDYSKLSQVEIFKMAKESFKKVGKTIFKNRNENIYVSNEDIKESIAKTIRSIKQKKLLEKHMQIFENLDKIIENGILIAKSPEFKGRMQYKYWEYYITPILLNNEKYIIEFDTVLRDNHQKHFRLERIYSCHDLNKKQVVPTGKIKNQSVTRFVEQPVSNKIPQ